MRSDLKRIIVDRPRTGGCEPKGYYKQMTKLGEDLPVKEGMKHRFRLGTGDTKSQSDTLAAIEGFLRKNVGRPWDKVYSEFCKNCDPRGILGYHARDHLFNFVVVKVQYVGDKVLDSAGCIFRENFYVCPNTKLLKACKQTSRKYRHPKRTYYWCEGEMAQFKQVDGVWYKFFLKNLPKGGFHDVYLKKYVDRTGRYDWEINGQARDLWGGLYYAYDKVQLNSKEIRKNKLPKVA